MITFSKLGSYGELGNQLFQVAATMGCAALTNDEYILPRWIDVVSGNDNSKYFLNNIPQTDCYTETFTTYIEPSFSYTPFKKQNSENIDLRGYFQSEKYFIHIEDIISKTFQPNQDINDKISLINFTDTVCIQLRFYDNVRAYGNRGIQLDTSSTNYYNPEENIPFLKEAINYFGKNKTYLVTTNNVARARNMFGVYDNFNFLEEYNFIEQFFIQTKCEHNIISNSSFGWWGAYLNNNPNKVIYAPKKWFKDNTVITDLIPEKWRLI
jgi:Glycosyl transferase family 11